MSIEKAKERAAKRAVEFVEAGQVLGLGTGSTAAHAIRDLGRRVAAGLRVTGVATSAQTEQLAKEAGVPLVSLNQVQKVDITIDGADQVDPGLNLIKGGGGALTREKLVALASTRRIIVVDWTKLVSTLGGTFPLPVEVLPFASRHTGRALADLDCKPRLRVTGEAPFVTDNGNYLVDCYFVAIENPAALEAAIKRISGVVECGLFVGITDTLIVGFEDRTEIRTRSL